MSEQELNEKLAKWAGFTPTYVPWEVLPVKKPIGWLAPGQTLPEDKSFVITHVPWFSSDLNACFKWLVPLLEPKKYELEISNDAQLFGWRVTLHSQTSECSVASPYEQFNGPEETAKALCLAIEELIDAEVRS